MSIYLLDTTLEDFPRAKLGFTSQGKYLVQIMGKRNMLGQNRLAPEAEFLPCPRVRTISSAIKFESEI